MSPNVVDPFDPKIQQPAGTTRELRQFSVAAACVLFVVAGVLYWRGGLRDSVIVWAGAGALVMAVGLLAPRVVQPLFLGLMAVTIPIGHFVSGAILGFVYFVVFTPIAVMFRLVGRDELRLRRPRGVSGWRPVDDSSNIKRYLKQF